MKKILTNLDIVILSNYFESKDSIINKTDSSIATVFLWKLRKNRKKIAAVLDDYKEALQDIELNYISDEKSVETIDENGNASRTVKPEYLEEFQTKRTELLSMTNELEIDTVTEEEFLNYIPTASYADVECLEFMIANHPQTEDISSI